MTTAVEARTVHVEQVMGTAFTVDVRDPGHWDAAMAEVIAWLHRVDGVFSTYREHSDISRIRRGELSVADADPDVATVLDLCAQAQVATGGAFSAMRGGRIDPTGLVKGWAIERASMILRAHGSSNHAVNGGGDMQLAGEAAPGRAWAVGIADPTRQGQLRAVVRGRELAVATSGTAERGMHIVDAFTGRPATGISSATVVGPSLTLADAYATAAVVLATDAPRWCAELPDYELLLVTAADEEIASAGWLRHVHS